MSNVVSRDVAESEFSRFIDMNDILLETPNMTADDIAAVGEQRERIIRAMMAGSLSVNENGEPIFLPQRSDCVSSLTFHEPTGASLMAADRKRKNEDIGKLYAAMADMTKTDIKTFSRMRMADLKICMAVTTLFLG